MPIRKIKKASGDGERAAISGYLPQYEIAASKILHHLRTGELEWIKIADPEAESIDDFQIATPGRLDAYQVKWGQYCSNVTYNHFISKSTDKEAPLLQLSKGWKVLSKINPDRQVVVHWLTNDQPSPNDGANIPVNDNKPTPCHFAAFLEQVLLPLRKKRMDLNSVSNQWKPALGKWLRITELPEKEQLFFLHNCELELRSSRPTEMSVNSVDDKQTISQIRKLTDWLIERVADSKRQIQFYSEEILTVLGVSEIQGGTLKQDFPIDEKIYRPIDTTTSSLDQLIKTSKGGYIALTGSPGSGKSTLLTQYLRYKPIRLARYYAYVPNTRDISVLRGESTSFLGSIINQFESIGFRSGNAIQTNDRDTLLQRFKSQIDLLHERYHEDGKISIILIDGLDHIHRELKPDRSLLADLPRPEEIPEGVFICLGSQTLNLPDLPRVIERFITSNARLIAIDPLARTNIFDIIQTFGLPVDPEQSDYDKIFELSNGHPLALRYILEQLQKSDDKSSFNEILDNKLIWKGNIDQHYEQYWEQIKPKDEIVSFLGLLSRIPGDIDLRWVNTWPEAHLLRKVEDKFGYLFRKESEIKWSIFHNSFRLFLIEKTRQYQPGLSSEECDLQYHKKLAENCDIPSNNLEFSWNKIYHLERSQQHQDILNNVSQNSLREQLYALRPRHAIWEDIYSALRSSSVIQDPVALMRLILAGRELESREDSLSHSELDIPEILIQIEEFEKAFVHIYDGFQLMVSEGSGLSYALQLFDLGKINEAKYIFELSEPIEYLSGSNVLKIHPGNEDPSILTIWAKAAIRFRNLSELVLLVPNIRAVWEFENNIHNDTNPSKRIQDHIYLTIGKELLFLRRHDDFDVLLDFIKNNVDKPFNTCFSLRTNLFEKYYYSQEKEQAKQVLEDILDYSQGQQLNNWQGLWLAEQLAKHQGSKENIQKLITGIPLLEIQDEYYDSRHLPLVDLSWDMIHVAIKYYLDEDTDLKTLVPDASDSQDKGKVLFRRAVASIGRIIGSSLKGELLDHAFLKQTYLPILKLFNQDWQTDRDWLNWHSYRSDRGRLFEYLIDTIQLHGFKQIDELKKAFENEWDCKATRQYWGYNTIRTVILALWEAGIPETWVIDRLKKLEKNMLSGFDISGRMQEINDQINAWLIIGEVDNVKSLLVTSLKSTFGIEYRKDYQLDCWIDWYQKIAKHEPSQALNRYQRIAEAILSLEGSTEGQDSAAIMLIKNVFEISPRISVMLFFYFWKSNLISYQEGLSTIIRQSLAPGDVNLTLPISAFTKLLLPLTSSVPDEITKDIITKVFLSNGRACTIQIANKIVDAIDVLALSHIRPALRYAVAQSLQSHGITQVDIANFPEPLLSDGDYSPSDKTILELDNSTKMTFRQVVDEISDAESFISLFQKEEKYKFFDWCSVVGSIFGKINNREIELLIDFFDKECKSWELLNAVATQFIENGNNSKARQILLLSINHIINGNGYFYDGVNRLDTFTLLKRIDPDEAIKQTYSFLISELEEGRAIYIFRSVDKVLGQIFEIICHDVPYREIGIEVDNYIEALLANEEKASIEFFNEEMTDDSSNRALGDLFCGNIDHDVSVICQLSREALTECIIENITECIDATKDELTNKPPSIALLLTLFEATKTTAFSCDCLDSLIRQLSEDNNIVIAQIAQDIAKNIDIEVPPLIPKNKIALPSTYSIIIDENVTWGIQYKRNVEEGELFETQDPRELVKPHDSILKAVSQETGIPFINLCMRAVRIVQRNGQEKHLSRGIEKQIKRRLEYTGLKMSYRRPRFRVMYPAVLEVIGELVKAGGITQSFLGLFKHLFHPYDAAFLSAKPVKRPLGILPISDVEGSMIELKNWVNRRPDNYTPEDGDEDFTILGEQCDIRRLVRGIPFENRATVCSFENDSEQSNFAFARLFDCCTEEYLNSDLRSNPKCPVVRNESQKTETNQVSWLAFNPIIAKELKWNYQPNDWFHWVDVDGDTMAKSIWWKDGLIEWYDTHFRENSVEVAEGWRVVISQKALSGIENKFGKLIRNNRILRLCYEDNGHKHQRVYNW